MELDIVDGCWVIILKSSSKTNGGFHRERLQAFRAEVEIGAEYKLKLVGLNTPDIDDIELA